jgi:hypothetical protein
MIYRQRELHYCTQQEIKYLTLYIYSTLLYVYHVHCKMYMYHRYDPKPVLLWCGGVTVRYFARLGHRQWPYNSAFGQLTRENSWSE